MACAPCDEAPSGLAAALLGGTKLIDCTHDITPESFSFCTWFKGVEECSFTPTAESQYGAVFPNGDPVPFTAGRMGTATIFDGRDDAPGGYRKCIFRMACDIGTHIDTPAHWYSEVNGKPARDASELTLQELTAAGAVVDVSAKADADSDYELTVEDIMEFEAKFGPLPAKCFVVMKTGWCSKFTATTDVYLGYGDTSGSTGDKEGAHFPGFSPACAEFLLKERDIVGIGIDTASLDFGQEGTEFPVHQAILGADKYQIENMKLEGVPEGLSATFVSLPLKVKGGPEAETRVMAVLHES